MNGKKIKISTVVILLIVLIALKFGVEYVWENELNSMDNIKYTLNTLTMDKIDVEGLERIVNKKSEIESTVNIVYFGRITCPYCIEAISKIKKIFTNYDEMKEETKSIAINQFYFDTKKYDDIKAGKLREKMGVKTVPTIAVIVNV